MKTKIMIYIILMVAIYYVGYVLGNDTKRSNDLFWIDNTRVHRDSIIDCSPIYDDRLNIIGEWIRVTYGESIIHIECLNTNDNSYQEYRDSWIMAFKEQIR